MHAWSWAITKQVISTHSILLLIHTHNHTHTFLLSQCQLDCPDTGKPLDTLTPQAQQHIQDLGSRNTKVSEIIGQKDQAVFTAIQKGLDKVNQSATSQAKRVGNL